MTGNERLFGLPHAERMHFDIDSAINEVLCDYDQDVKPDSFMIEEWTTTSADLWLPSTESTLEWMVESTADEAINEDLFEAYSTAAQHPAVKAAMQQVNMLLASKVGYRMANKMIATHHVTFSFDGTKVFVDGQFWNER